MRDDLLSEIMRMSVLLRIEALREKGGPSKDDIDKAQKASDMLGERGDVLLFGNGNKGEVADIFNHTAHAIAVLAFCPGGVSLFGMRFDGSKGMTDEPEHAE